MIVAVDGPAASGKGTLARRIAEHLGYAYLDTGKLYRAAGIAVLRDGGDPKDPAAAEKAAREFVPAMVASGGLDDAALKTEQAADAASKVAAIPEVRAALLDLQRGFAANPPRGESGAVLDGRDIGTVICPDAPAKLFVTASVETRAERRHKELLERGEASIYARVLQEMTERDERDRSRAAAPMKPASDAVVLDTTAMTADQAFAHALAEVQKRLP